jgi:hypothetical protein
VDGYECLPVETVVKDSFVYTGGVTLDNLSGGTGNWSGAWDWTYTSGGSLVTDATGFTYPGLVTSGGKATWGPGSNQIAQCQRSLPRQHAGVTYFQLIMQTANGGFGTPSIRMLDSVAPGQTWAIGNNGGADTTHITIMDGSLTPVPGGVSTALLSAVNLVIVRIDYDAQATSVFINPDMSTFDYGAPPAATLSISNFAPAFDLISINFRVSSSLDELHILSTE